MGQSAHTAQLSIPDMELEIVNAKSSKPVVTLAAQPSSSTIGDLKKAIGSAKPKYKDVNRQELRQEAKGKPLKDEATLESLGITESTTLYFKDRGTQIAWTTVFMAEYMGPLVVYLLFYIRPWLVYGDTSKDEMSTTTHIAAAAWTFHYAKRVLETIFVHRFSNATMPLAICSRTAATTGDSPRTVPTISTILSTPAHAILKHTFSLAFSFSVNWATSPSMFF
eukprot:TRINITY_DN9754_c0_g1_i1.p1 TRINITY_DN9754_c0_g1~~TRINITY_DN9754_c0_g1_i1.p1  ORF type:complete len:223 (-),score=52.49 TRINITY_DN9754_c0_g1_i1:300-968(-)